MFVVVIAAVVFIVFDLQLSPFSTLHFLVNLLGLGERVVAVQFRSISIDADSHARGYGPWIDDEKRKKRKKPRHTSSALGGRQDQ